MGIASIYIVFSYWCSGMILKVQVSGIARAQVRTIQRGQCVGKVIVRSAVVFFVGPCSAMTGLPTVFGKQGTLNSRAGGVHSIINRYLNVSTLR